MTPMRRRLLLISVALVILIQLIPINRSNPPVTADLEAPQGLHDILRRACLDCHSNETVWPWYSRVAPASWLVALDVHEGRRHLNFSSWHEYPTDRQEKLRRAIDKAVSEDEMPPLQYLLAHPEARLTEADRHMLTDWFGKNAAR